MSLNGTVWAPIGPSPIDQGAITANGQVTAIAVNPNNPKIIYIGTAWGGVWLTRDGGNTWTPIFDRAPSLGVGDPGALAIDPIDTNVLYVGTTSREGSVFAGGSESTQPPAGLFKSNDGGASWICLGSGYPPGPRPMRTSSLISSSPSSLSIRSTIRPCISHPTSACLSQPMAALNGPRASPPPAMCVRLCWIRPLPPPRGFCTLASPGRGLFSPRTGAELENRSHRRHGGGHDGTQHRRHSWPPP